MAARGGADSRAEDQPQTWTAPPQPRALTPFSQRLTSAVLPVPPGGDQLHHRDPGAGRPGGVERRQFRPAAEEVLGAGGEVVEVDAGGGRGRAQPFAPGRGPGVLRPRVGRLVPVAVANNDPRCSVHVRPCGATGVLGELRIMLYPYHRPEVEASAGRGAAR
ncbi:hypothetical protein THSYN_01325 [Candidatus Thiodictyon syntrophicum]|uniref:Uncharacterized protein n=1 Tax=Candidatus Thiodictyon syntrophicum TaxID=1166950 RepID=A0A2K8U2T7_9GAMM|nr:hypothetical protein THSYN_01325 [Candidatus Thiodictyon syntrophicum]